MKRFQSKSNRISIFTSALLRQWYKKWGERRRSFMIPLHQATHIYTLLENPWTGPYAVDTHFCGQFLFPLNSPVILRLLITFISPTAGYKGVGTFCDDFFFQSFSSFRLRKEIFPAVFNYLEGFFFFSFVWFSCQAFAYSSNCYLPCSAVKRNHRR